VAEQAAVAPEVIVRCTSVTPGIHKAGEAPLRIEGTANEVKKACYEKRVMCECDNAATVTMKR
jgi:phage tail tube protein FII